MDAATTGAATTGEVMAEMALLHGVAKLLAVRAETAVPVVPLEHEASHAVPCRAWQGWVQLAEAQVARLLQAQREQPTKDASARTHSCHTQMCADNPLYVSLTLAARYFCAASTRR
eukprot:1441264-Prymnesium_polylepis.1